jgi:toxin ParE1/3/4
MRVRWTTDAADDLERICDYIATSRPGAAQNVAVTIVRRIADLETFPQLGRQGRVDGTRELTFASLPFVAVYEVHSEEVQVLRILHGARQWPPANDRRTP